MPSHSASEIAAALIELYRGSRGATLRAIQESASLMTLRHVNAYAGERHRVGAPQEDAVAAACVDALVDASNRLGAPAGRAAGALIGVSEGARRADRPTRERRAARLLETSREALTHRRKGSTQAEELIRDLAEAVREIEDEFVLREASTGIRQRQPVDSGLALNMLERYEHYYRMVSELSALRADSYAALSLARQGDDGVNKLDDYIASSLFNYAAFLTLKQDFIRKRGGIWMLSDADAERAVADSIKLIEHFSPLTYIQESWARIAILEHTELYPFVEKVRSSGDGRQLERAWRTRVLTCACKDLDAPDPGCKVHDMMLACSFYIEAIDADWYRLVPWYRDPPRYRKLVDPATLYRDIGLLGSGD